MKMLIGIPAFNEQKIIEFVLRLLPKKIDGVKKIDVLVVDDGSSDKTAELAKKHATCVLCHIINRGLGGALKTIFAYARQKEYDILVTLDADGQHNPKDISGLIKPILQKKANVVIGTRWVKKNAGPKSRLFINKIANIITYLLYGIMSTDSQSGFRAFDKKAIMKIELKNDGMEVSSEIFKEIYKNKLLYEEFPINAVYTEYSLSKGQSLNNAPNIIMKLLLRLLS